MNLKRGQNQGSIYQRGSDRRWVAQVTDVGKHKLAYFHPYLAVHNSIPHPWVIHDRLERSTN